MIVYPPAKCHPRMLFQMRGSVFPFAFAVATPCALVAVILKLLSSGHLAFFGLDVQTQLQSTLAILSDSAGFSGINFLLGFLIVFRTSQAYARFWEGHTAVRQMCAEWLHAASSFYAFSQNSVASPDDVIMFHHTLARLLSLLHASALMQLSVGAGNDMNVDSARAFELELIDANGLDEDSLMTLNGSDDKVALIFQWVQQLVVRATDECMFSPQAPIVTRGFAELANGMGKFCDALRITEVAFPFPYVQTTELLLVLHWMVTPFLICSWTKSPLWTGILAFFWIFIFWSLNAIATEIEDPFGEDANDLPAREAQRQFNQQVLLYMRPSTLMTPRLTDRAEFDERPSDNDPDELCLGRLSTLSSGGIQLPDERYLAGCYRHASRKISLGALRQSISDQKLKRQSLSEQYVNRRSSSKEYTQRLSIISDASCQTVESIPRDNIDEQLSIKVKCDQRERITFEQVRAPLHREVYIHAATSSLGSSQSADSRHTRLDILADECFDELQTGFAEGRKHHSNRVSSSPVLLGNEGKGAETPDVMFGKSDRASHQPSDAEDAKANNVVVV